MKILSNALLIVLFIFLASCGSNASRTNLLASDPVILAAGDIANGASNDEATAKLLDAVPDGTVITLGDNAYPDGSPSNFTQFYEPTWGRHKNRTMPSPGNHDYHTAGASGYYNYFGASAHGPNGYYSYNLGAWHIISLNSEIDHTSTSAQVTWLKNDLAANPAACVMAYWHKPRFSSGALHGSNTGMAPFWQVLYAAGADVILTGHDHEYERFAPLNPNGALDSKGIRQFVVGTGGASLYSFGTPLTGSEVRNNTTWGVLKMTLHSTSYDWEFVPVAGKTFTDKGTGNCSGASGVTVTPPTNTPTPTKTNTPTSTFTNTPTNTATNTVTPTNTNTPTITSTPTFTDTPTPTSTLVGPTDTSLCPTPKAVVTFEIPNSENFFYYICADPLPTSSPTPTVTPSPTLTGTPPAITVINYDPSNADILNPERGFLRQSSIFLNQPFDTSKVRAISATDSLAWVYFRLDNYRDPRDGVGVTLSDYQGKPLDANALSVLQSTFDAARNKGLKLVIRFVYNPGPGSTTNPLQANPDVPLNVALGHISQIKPILQSNADVIYSMEIGFIGHWGEWHSSKYMGNDAARSAILSASLDALPVSRSVMLRYPRYKEAYYGGPASAFDGSVISRIGTYDDAFLKSDDDDGTFKSNTAGVKISNYCDGQNEIDCWRGFISQDTLFTPFGGEASLDNAPRTGCVNALAQLSNLHASFLNNRFNTNVLNRWTNEGCMPEIRRSLGYRFVLESLSTVTTWSKSGDNDYHIELINKGFAPMYNQRPVYFVLKSGTFSRSILTTIDPRQWKPNEPVSIDGSFGIPSDVPAGSYSLYLWLPDAYPSLQSKPAYSVQFANIGVWENGMNFLMDIQIVP